MNIGQKRRFTVGEVRRFLKGELSRLIRDCEFQKSLPSRGINWTKIAGKKEEVSGKTIEYILKIEQLKHLKDNQPYDFKERGKSRLDITEKKGILFSKISLI